MIRFPDEHRVTRGSAHETARRNLIGYSLETRHGEHEGLFILPALVPGRPLRCVASEGLGWEHVSVSIEGRPDRCPTWPEMDAVRHAFWPAWDVVVQYHPATSEHRSIAEVLHLWRPVTGAIPTPPGYLVAPRDDAGLDRLRELSASSLTEDEIASALDREGR